jgi:anaphase-promoting complex subunit 2
MVRDILTSRHVDHQIRHAQKLDPSPEEIVAARSAPKTLKEDVVSPEGLQKPSLHAKILSRLFWPQLHDETYRVPSEISDLQKRYESGFERLKNARKLTWLPSLGQATVELDLEDRVVFEEVHTWQATVIWAFQSETPNDKSLSRTVEELVENLEMDEALVRSALKFWAGKLVLHETSKDRYVVLETLNKEDRIRSANAQAATATTTAADSTMDDGVLAGGGTQAGQSGGILGSKEKEEMYWQFIQGMLKNSAAKMPLAQIGMMLKMLIVEGFPHGNEELREFLALKVESAELEIVGGKYRLKK